MRTPPAHVVCVDDDAGDRDIVAERLRSSIEGAYVSTAADADEAEAIIEAAGGAVDCVVSDFEMPGRDGLDLLATVRDRWADLPFLLFTGDGNEAVASDAISAGVTDYVRKGDDDSFDLLERGVRAAVREHHADTVRRAERCRLLVESSDDAMAVLEAGRYRFVNDACGDLFEAAPEEIVGTTDRDLLPASIADALETHSERAIADGGAVTQHLEVPTSEGSRFFDILHVPHAVGADAGVARVCREVTDQVERERLLREERDRLESLAGTVAHDARNAIQLIAGRTQLAREAAGEDAAAVDRNLGSVEDGVDRLFELVASLESLRGVSDPVLDPTPVSIGDAATDAWRTVDAPDAELRIDDAPVLTGDPKRVRTLLENLLRNAVDHAGPEVTVTVERTDDGAGFAVADDGPGIPADERDRVLEFGYTSGSGTGFGLGIVAGIAEAHGWSLEVTAAAGGGARFEFREETIDSFVS